MTAAPIDGADAAPDAGSEFDVGTEQPLDALDAFGDDVGPPDSDKLDDSGDEPPALQDGGDASEECPIVAGGCTPGCTAAYGWHYDTEHQCFTTPALLTCYQFDSAPAQSLPTEAPDGGCWLVHSLVGKLMAAGWKTPSDPRCLTATMNSPWCNGADPGPEGQSCATLAQAASLSGQCDSCVSDDGLTACTDALAAAYMSAPPCASVGACGYGACGYWQFASLSLCSCMAGCMVGAPAECLPAWTELFECLLEACSGSC